MRKLRGFLRKVLFVVYAHKVEKHNYPASELKTAGWLSSIELPNYGTLAFEDTEGHYRFTW